MKNTLTIFLFVFASSVFGQSPCNDVTIESVKYSPFTDSLVVVHLVNAGSEIFSYPGFVLINTAGDTVAQENVDLFGIGSESVHRLVVRPGVQDPLEDFQGSLELHTGFFYDTLWCEWAMNQSLCADEPCDSLIIGLENYSGGLVTGDFEWSVFDDTSNVVESGQFTMVAEVQTWRYGLCLSPGEYTYSLTALTSPSGGGPTLTASSSRSYASPRLSAPLDWFNDPSGVLEIPFFTFCNESPNGILDQNIDSELPSVFYNSDNRELVCAETMSYVKIYSTLGVLVSSIDASNKVIGIPSLPAGAYLVVASTLKGEIRNKFVLQ
ncbi:MAG: hypothetical protein ACI9CU_000741 [Polaribacter sp.]|jgi:hypothetical protein